MRLGSHPDLNPVGREYYALYVARKAPWSRRLLGHLLGGGADQRQLLAADASSLLAWR